MTVHPVFAPVLEAFTKGPTMIEDTKATKEERIAALREVASRLRRRAEALYAEAYEVDAEVDDLAGDHASAEYNRALARGDGARGYIRLRAKQFIARGHHYEGDDTAMRALIAAEVERLRAESGESDHA